MAKKYKIASVDYEFSIRALNDASMNYSDKEWNPINDFWSDWSDYPLGYDDKHKKRGFNPKDGYDYVDNIEELIPPQLKPEDKELFRNEIKKHLIKL
ncbi:hypothetical protein N4599_02600 [Limosilactobacillus oris]|uniref:hypothetical protein n=1 Tax=Limosilactobacillus oris TaxID=1632 RepID=UPI0021B1945B|nr:hypothetical protein [Limosilactobacillus oris]UXC67852.1 hypothetical protein N4599_02600 [Limosilactobacillus oris]